MANENEDVKPQDDATSASPTQEGASSQQDVTQESSTSTTTETKPVEQKPLVSLDSILDDAVKQATKVAPTEEKKEETTKVEGETKVEEGKVETTEKKEDDKSPIPYERFHEVNTKKNEAERTLTEFKPLVEAHMSVVKHCTDNNITEEEFRYWMEMAALAKNDPAKALERLQPQLQSLQSFTGDVLPPDLRASVEAGEITEPMAKRIAAAESKGKLSTQQAEQIRQQQQQQREVQQQQQTNQAIQTALGTWAQQQITSDPDFKPKAQQDAPDGKYELFLYRLKAEINSAKELTPQTIVQIAIASKKAIDASFGALKPKVNGQTHIRSSQSGTSVRPQIKTLDDAMAAGARAVGVEFNPRS
jgi:hypothetical protein